jgi:hypothetical protein
MILAQSTNFRELISAEENIIGSGGNKCRLRAKSKGLSTFQIPLKSK